MARQEFIMSANHALAYENWIAMKTHPAQADDQTYA